MKIAAGVILCLSCLVACGDSGPPLLVSDVQIIAPLPGRENSAAYMKLSNPSGSPLTISSFSSPQFGSIEMHETVTADGIARMSVLETLVIPGRSVRSLETGGKHLMLLEPRQGLIPGQPVTLEIHYDDGGILLVEAPLMSRLQVDAE